MPARAVLLLPLSTWLLANVALASGSPQVGAASAIAVDAKTGKVLWSRAPDVRRYPASTTKILTTLIFLESVPAKQVISAPLDIEGVTGSSLYLKPFERVSAEDLAYAIMLRSANDAAYTAALRVGGTIEGFADLMNARALEIGCRGSHFTNPHGLHDERHYTTARDLALIAREALGNERFARIVRTERRGIDRSDNDFDVLLLSRNEFLKRDDSATGIKTGWTDPAGRCFVGSAERDGVSIITVVLKGQDWLADTEHLVDWTFDNWGYARLAGAGEVVAELPARGYRRGLVRLVVHEEVRSLAAEGKDLEYEPDLAGLVVRPPLRKGQEVGTLVLREPDGTEHPVTVYSADDVAGAGLFTPENLLSPSWLAIIAALAGGAWLVRRKVRRAV